MSARNEIFSHKFSDLNSMFDAFVSRFSTDFSGTSDSIAEREELLRYLNEKCNDEGDTLLMKAIECERMDVVKLCLRFDEIDVNAENEREARAIDIAWEKRNYDCMVILLSKDSVFPDDFYVNGIDATAFKGMELQEIIDRRKLLHSSIKDGVLSSVKELAEKENSLTFYSPENMTAIYCAIEYGKHEIYAYLLSIGAKLGKEEKDLLGSCDEDELEKFQNALEDYFIPFENSHISTLISATKLLGNFTDVEIKAVKNIFEWLDTIQFTKFLMKAVQYEKIEIIFDFNSELVDRIYPEFCLDEIYGLYVTKIHRIYIGAKNCTLNETGFRSVAGTVAHELCHRAMHMLYNNYACPYNQGSIERKNLLEDVHKKISKSLECIGVEIPDKIEKWDSVMKVYLMQPSHAELIVRVPHILGIYGEEEGQKILKDKIPELLRYYTDFIHRDLVEYTGLSYFSKPLCSIETLSNVIGALSEEERSSSPFLTLTSYEDHIFQLHDKSILLTSNPKLCMLHVYHILKQKFPFHIHKQCLFIDLKDLDDNLDVISQVSQCKLFHCLVLLWREVDEEIEYSKYITEGIEENKNIILIAHEKCKQLQQHIKETEVLHYPWSNLNDDFKRKILSKIVIYQGMNTCRINMIKAFIDNKAQSEIINPEVLSYLMQENNINIGPEFRSESLFCSKSLYIPRSFHYYSNKSLIDNLEKGSYYLLLTGWQKTNIENLKIGKQFIHELENKSEFQPEKYLIVPKKENPDLLFYQEYLTNMTKIVEKTSKKSIYWLHHEYGDFCLRYSHRYTDADFLEEQILKEEELVIKIFKKRVVIVADDPGAGKSTVINSLMEKIKKKRPYILLGRIDLSKYAVETSSHLSLHHIKYCSSSEDILKYFYNILGLKTCLELSLMCYLQKTEGNVIIMIDSFDEVVPLFKVNALKLLRTLLNETKIHICIFTRTHEKLGLEKEMNSSSISLCPFSYDDQVKFLNNFWRFKLESLAISNEYERIQCIEKVEALILVLKNIDEGNDEQKLLDTTEMLRSFVNDIQSKEVSRETLGITDGTQFNKCDFEKYSRFVLKNVNSDITDKGKPLTSLPLHLFMIANIIYNESFTVRLHVSIFNLYFDFLESKITTYLREKCLMKSETRDSKIVFDVMREVILNTLTRVLGNLLGENQLSLLRMKDDKYLEIVQHIGLVRKEKGHIHFIHMTIQEFVFFTLIKEKIKSDTLEAELFSEILFKEIYQRTVEYLDSFFQTDDAINVNFSYFFLKNFYVSEKFIDYLKYYEKDKKGCSFMSCNIWKKILKNYEIFSEKDEANRLPPKIALHLKQSYKYNFQTFKFLTQCLSDEILMEVFDQNANLCAESIGNILGEGSLDEVCEVIKFLDRMLSFKIQTGIICEGEASPELKLFNVKLLNYPPGNMFHRVSKNKDEKSFCKLFQFATKFMDRRTLSNLLIEYNGFDDSILHLSAVIPNRNMLTIMEELEIYLDRDNFLFLLSPESNKKFSFLNTAALWSPSSVYYESLIEYLSEVMESETLRELFLKLDCNKSSILHYAAMNKNKKIFKITAKRIHRYIQGEKLEKFIRWGCYNLRTIFRIRGEKSLEFKDLNIVEKLMRKEKFNELLMASNDQGTCAHCMCNSNSPLEVICSNIGYFVEKFDEDSLENFILAQDRHGNTFLHILADKSKEKDMSKFYLCLESKLSDSLLKKLLNKENHMGQVVKIEKNEGSISLRMMKNEN